MSLVFPSVESLQAVLRAGLVPSEVQQAPVRYALRATGELELESSAPVSASQMQKLKLAGVVEKPAAKDLSDASCWAAAVPVMHLGEADSVPPVVLFVLPRSKDLIALCGELLRLGCDRQELQSLSDGRAVVRVREPPFYVVARASEGDGLRVFVPTPSGQDAVWSELGCAHPLVDLLEPPPEGALLIRADGAFEPLPLGAWTPLDKVIVPAGVPQPHPLDASALPRIDVTLRLSTSARRDEPSLWLLPDGLAQVESLVRNSPEAALEAVLFAVSGSLVVLKARPGREKAVGALPGVPYARVNELANLYAPVGSSIEPPISRERVREWLAADTDLVTWLTPRDASFARESLPERAFRPLTEWVEYVIDTSVPELTAWEKSATFAFDDFIGVEMVPGTDRERADETPDAESLKTATARKGARTPARPERTTSSRDLSAAAAAAVAEVRRIEPTQLEAQIREEETAFVELDAPADSTERGQSWLRLARLYHASGQAREAGLAWGHAAWEATGADALAVSRSWAEAVGTPLQTLLQIGSPTQEQTRFVVAQLLSLAESGDTRARGRVPEAQAWLDKHDENLDVRSLWLGRYALARLAGSDKLALARARDRLLNRLRRGLSLERDVPRFLRAVGPGTSRDASRVARVHQHLETVLKAFDETQRKKSVTEAPWPLTRAYVGFEFAWGFARLGDVRRARALEEAAVKALDLNKPVHQVLTRAYQTRIAQATEGLPPDAPLPAEHGASLNALINFQRYQVDRLRQASTVLEPQERLNAFTRFTKYSSKFTGDLLGALREVEDSGQLAAAIEERAQAAEKGNLSPEGRAELLDALLDFLLQLPESSALPMLQRFVVLAQPLPPRLQITVLEDALKVAGHFGRGPLVRQLVMTLSGLLSELKEEAAVDVGTALATSVRSMRRVGLRDEAATLLQRAAQMLRGDSPEWLIARLSLAGGFAYLGRMDLATPIFDEALSVLPKEGAEMLLSKRLRLARATAQALAHTPSEFALPRLLRFTAMLPFTTDQFNTNDNFCLSVVDLADTLVIGHVGEDLTLSELTRSFLEEDEYLVRRRVHRDAGQG